MTFVTVDIDLSEIDTWELIEELSARGRDVLSEYSTQDLIHELENRGEEDFPGFIETQNLYDAYTNKNLDPKVFDAMLKEYFYKSIGRIA